MSEIPGDLRYTKSHEWVKVEEDGNLTVGITDHAQEALGDLVFVEVPEVGVTFQSGDACAVVESVKAASDVYCPVSGEVQEANEVLAEKPERLNEDAYGDGWIMRIQAENDANLDGLMNADGYRAFLKQES